MPVKVFDNIKKRIRAAHVFSFVFSFVFGLAAHMYRMVNWLPNWDSLVFRNDPQHMEPLGRWFLAEASAISGNYELPWLNGLLALLYLGTAAAVLCEIFDVRSRLSAAAIGAVTVTFPTVISTFTYCYVVDAYSLSFLFVCVAVYLLTKKKLTAAIPATVLLVLSLGIYQAYITAAIALLMCCLIKDLTTGKSTVSETIKSALKYLVCGVLAFILYYAVNSAVLSLLQTGASDYQNISDTLALKEIDIKSAVVSAYYVFFKFFFDFSSGFNLYSALNIAIFAVLFIGYLTLAVKNLKNAAGYILSLALILLIPLGCTALYIANSELDYHNLMKMSYFIVYIYLILLYENLELAPVLNAVKAWAVPVLCFMIVFSNTVTANIAYHKLQIAYERSYGILVRISDRIETLDGSENFKKILVVGKLKDSDAYSVDFPPDITGTTDGLILRHEDETVGQSVVTSALNDYCDMSLEFVFGDEAKALKSSQTVKDMPCWPSNGSVGAIGDTVVLKLSDEAE